jgi:CHAT domain-containing protein
MMALLAALSRGVGARGGFGAAGLFWRLLLVVLTSSLACSCAPKMSADELNTTLRRLKLIKELKRTEQEQDWQAHLEVARRLVAMPIDPDTRVESLALAIDALADYADFHGLSPGMDEEARRYYQEGAASASPEQQAQIDHVMTLYYSKSARNGLAIPYVQSELAYWESVDDRVQVMLAYDGLASIYHDMGELALSDHYRQIALGIGRDYFEVGVRPPPGNAWISYSGIIWKWADRISGPGQAEAVLELWKLQEPIYDEYLKFEHKGLAKLAGYLAISGDHERAAHTMSEAEKVWEEESARNPQFASMLRRDLICSKAQIAVWAEDFQEANGLFEQCVALSEQGKLDAALYRLQGTAHEGVGDLSGAVAAYHKSLQAAETLRGSYGVAERAAFFRSVVRKSYWGLIRAQAKLAAASRDERQFFQALAASETIRARQLGELIDPGSSGALDLGELRAWRASLPAEEVVISYILTDREIVTLAFSRDDWISDVHRHDGAGFDQRVRNLVGNLATPDSSLSDIHQELEAVSRQVLGPVRDLVARSRSILAITDGSLSLLPFDLLHDPAGRGRPLVHRQVVRATPSLRFALLKRQPPSRSAARSLFAVADPSYRRGYQVAGLSSGALRSVTRGSDYLSYFSPLPETRREVEAISGLFPQQGVATLLGGRASESAIKRADLRDYRFLHLATHGILGGEVPGVAEPALVLAEEQGEDGFLTASEVAELKLGADMAVLSACKTGTGEYVTGEGVMGMSRAFLIAGTQAVVVSLWSVDSKATEELMVLFYQRLKAGELAQEALRGAKLELFARVRSGASQLRGIRVEARAGARRGEPHPFFWAPFVLVGGQAGVGISSAR